MSLRLGVWGMKSPNVSLSKVTRKPQPHDSPLSPKAVYGGENAERLHRPVPLFAYLTNGYMDIIVIRQRRALWKSCTSWAPATPW